MRSQADFRDYQHSALAHCVRHRRSYLAAKAGAGKTAVGLALIDVCMFDLFEVTKALVVAPKRVAAQWPEAAKDWEFSKHLRFEVYMGPKDQRQAALAKPHDVMCVSFEHFVELVQTVGLGKWPYGLVIFDEASRLRKGGRQGSVTWKTMNAISARTDARLLLMSGSPRPGTAHELFAPVFVLDRGQALGTTLTGFRAKYLEPHMQNRHTGQVYSWKLRAGMEEQLYGAIGHLYFAVSPDLGLPSVVVDRRVELPGRVEQMARTLMRDQVVDLDELEVSAPSQGNVTGKVHQMGQGAVFDDERQVVVLHSEKLDELQEVIDELDCPVVVAYWYSHDKDRLMERFPTAVDISTEQGLAAAKGGQVEIALLHPGSAGHGIDGLQFAYSAIVWFALPASFELYDQTNKRIVRSGQSETVRVIRLIAGNGLVDDRIVERLAEKEAEQEAFFEYLEGQHGR